MNETEQHHWIRMKAMEMMRQDSLSERVARFLLTAHLKRDISNDTE